MTQMPCCRRILDRLWKQTVKDANGIILSEQRYAYDNTGVPAATVALMTNAFIAAVLVERVFAPPPSPDAPFAPTPAI